MRRPCTILAAAALAAIPSLAHAQSPVRESADAISLSGSSAGSYRSKANDWMIMPKGMTTIGGHVKFITSEAGLGPDGLKLTDVMITSLNIRAAVTRRIELFGSLSFLPKQPSFTDESAWQSASAGAMLGFHKRFAAYATGGTGPLLDDRGMWAAGATGLQGRKSLHSTLFVEGGIGGAYTALFDDTRNRSSWLAEVTTSAQMIFRVPNGMMAGWIGTELRFPIADDSAMSNIGEAAHDPQTRASIDLGVVLSYIDNWDIFFKISVIDRGDAIDPATTLPILDGGFDQQQFVIGMTHRFEPQPEHQYQYAVAE